MLFLNLALPIFRLRSNYLRFISLVFMGSLISCTSSELFLVNNLVRLDDYKVIKNLKYGTNQANLLDLYRPAQPSKNFASIVFYYGGCWGGCETLPKEDYAFIAQTLTTLGYAVIIPNYRHYPEVKFDSMMTDTAEAFEWSHTHISEYGGDPNRIFIMGHSAGAHLGAMLALNENYLKKPTYQALKGFVGLAGPYDFLPLTADYQKAIFGPEQSYPASQPINFVTGTEPPLLLLFGKDDVTVKPVNIASLKMRAKQAGGCVESHEYKNLDHLEILGALSFPLKNSEQVLPDIARFLAYYAVSHQKCKQ
jgi:acetyl esterase/lipase